MPPAATHTANPQEPLTALADDTVVNQFLSQISERWGSGIVAVILYGSYLRGARDTLLDFYVLLDQPCRTSSRMERLTMAALPPNVFFLTGPGDSAAKVAAMGFDQLMRAVEIDFHSYFWARFVQPFYTVFARDEASRKALSQLPVRAAATAIRETLPLMPPNFSARELWVKTFRETYRAELRSEGPERSESLVTGNHEVLSALLNEVGPLNDLVAGEESWAQPEVSGWKLWISRQRWRARRITGKVLSLARLFKAAFTFNDPLGYVLWKVERHSGIRETASERQRRHPLVFGWGVLWRLYRRGGFR